MTWSAYQLLQEMASPVPNTTPGGFSMRRRNLYRTLAAVVAVAAITPLFAADHCGGRWEQRQQISARNTNLHPR